MTLPACSVCGHEPSLPTISPEMLYFRSTHNEMPKRGPVMPDGSFAVAFAGVIYTMTGEAWDQYQAMSQAAAAQDKSSASEVEAA